MIHLIAAAISSGTLGAPNVVTISDNSSTGNNGRVAGIVFYSSGNFAKYVSDVPNVVSTWLTPQSNFSQYEIRATLSAGDTPTTGTLNTWQALSTTREWTLTTAVVEETLSSTLLIEIRWTGNNVVQDSATYTLTAHGPLV